MFDNLRKDAAASPLYEEEAQFQPAAGTKQPPRKSSGPFLGMKPVQRFIIAVMLMIAVITLGLMCLLVTGRLALY